MIHAPDTAPVSDGTYHRGCRCAGCRAAHAVAAVRYNNSEARMHRRGVCSVDDCVRVDDGGRGWCQMHYTRWKRHGDPLTAKRRFDLTPDERNLARVIRLPNGCWLWTGRRDAAGYGRTLDQNGRPAMAHRWSYEYHVGPIPPDRHLDHLCRVEACVNPTHLEPVTMAVNLERGAHRTLGRSIA